MSVQGLNSYDFTVTEKVAIINYGLQLRYLKRKGAHEKRAPFPFKEMGNDMVWLKDFYAGEGIAEKKQKIKWKIIHNVGQFNIYVIALSSSPSNLLDIIPSWELMQRYYPKQDMLIVGVDKGYDNAIELAAKIVIDVFHKTGNLNIRNYFLDQYRKNSRRSHLWESCC